MLIHFIAYLVKNTNAVFLAKLGAVFLAKLGAMTMLTNLGPVYAALHRCYDYADQARCYGQAGQARCCVFGQAGSQAG